MIRTDYISMAQVIEDYAKDPANQLMFEVQTAQDKSILDLQDVKDLFEQHGWTIEEYHSLTKYDQDPIDLELYDISATLEKLGYDNEFIERVLVAFIVGKQQ